MTTPVIGESLWIGWVGRVIVKGNGQAGPAIGLKVVSTATLQ